MKIAVTVVLRRPFFSGEENKMAKDEYYVIVAKILVYLYAKLKGKNKTPAVEYIHAMSNDFPKPWSDGLSKRLRFKIIIRLWNSNQDLR